MNTVTGQRSNQLNYVPTRQINEMRNRQCLCGFASIAYGTPVAPGLPKERDFWLNRRQIVASLCAFSDVQKNLRGPLQATQVVTTLDPTANKL
jgi:hypothetical protein